MSNTVETETPINESRCSASVGRSVKTRNFTNYHYKLNNKNNDDSYEFYKRMDEITAKYGISRANLYLLIRDPEKERRKYNHLEVEKINTHYLIIEQGVDPAVIRS